MAFHENILAKATHLAIMLMLLTIARKPTSAPRDSNPAATERIALILMAATHRQ